jgi:hypothetical protein
MKSTIQDAVIFLLCGTIVFLFFYTRLYYKPGPPADSTSSATLLVAPSPDSNTPSVTVLPEYHPCDTEYQWPGLEVGNNWGSRADRP